MNSSNRTFAYKVNDKPYTTKHQYLTGREIKEQSGVAADCILLLVRSGRDNERISDDQLVNLAMPGIEKFITRPPVSKQELIINGIPIVYEGRTVSYEEVVRLSGNTLKDHGYTVVFFDGPKENPNGELGPGESVYVQDQMRFNVTGSHLS